MAGLLTARCLHSHADNTENDANLQRQPPIFVHAHPLQVLNYALVHTPNRSYYSPHLALPVGGQSCVVCGCASVVGIMYIQKSGVSLFA